MRHIGGMLAGPTARPVSDGLLYLILAQLTSDVPRRSTQLVATLDYVDGSRQLEDPRRPTVRPHATDAQRSGCVSASIPPSAAFL
jgi:hypothetical protein